MAKISSPGVIDPEKTDSNLSQPLGAFFWSKNGHLKPFFGTSLWQIQRSQLHVLTDGYNRQIEALPLVFRDIKKTKLCRCEKAILWPIYLHTFGERTELWSFLQGDCSWLSYSQDTFEVQFWSYFLVLSSISYRAKENLTRVYERGHLVADLWLR